MSKKHFFLYIVIWLHSFTLVVSLIDPLSAGLVVGAGAGLKYIYDKTIHLVKETCSNEHLIGDITGLERSLKENFYGQHVALQIIVGALRAHQRYSSKALTLSLHGLPGTGKNYVTTFIKEHLYKMGKDSKFVHHYMGRVHFSEASKVPKYKVDLYQTIKESVSACPHQLFIFDEVDKIPAGVLDVLKPIIDYNEYVDGVDYRKAIFIFLSNTGSSAITDEMLRLWRYGKQREDIKMSDFERLLSIGAFNEEGGFYHSDAIKSNLIDHYIPFLPMQLEQVKQCIKKEYRNHGINNPTEEEINEVIEFVDWAPEPENIFAKTGCKRLSQKVSVIVSRRYYQ